jgi:radical SAM protein with 4Fe4S-binding SPASM domain
MECPSTISDMEYLDGFARKIALLRVAYSGGLDFTNRCNLRCIHCYVGSARYRSGSGRGEMAKDEVLAILDEIRDAGCLHFLITGGEPLLRADFRDVYEHAKRIGLIVTVFTNGTLITGEVLDLFADLPPCAVEISLYGATAETYEKITGVGGSFAACIKGIEGLTGIGVNLTLKTMQMSLNNHEFFEIERMARAYGAKFRFDAALFPRFDGDRSPLSLRLSAEEAVSREFTDKRLRQWKEFFRRRAGIRLGEKLYRCGAAVSSFHIDAEGHLLPCIMARNFRYDLLGGSFADGWNNVMPRFREKETIPGNPCVDCDAISLCGFCPAFFLIENGDENHHSDYLCRMGKMRYAEVNREVTGKEV